MDKVVQFRGTVYEDGSGMVAQKVMRDKEISMTAKAIYAYLCTFAWGGVDNERKAFPSVATQCKELGIKSDKTYFKHRKQLEEAGYITIEKTGRNKLGEFQNNIYYIEAVTHKTTIQQNLPYGKNYRAVKNTVLRKQKNTLNNKINNIKQQQTEDVVVVQDKVKKLFGKKLSKKNVQTLINLADKYNAPLDAKIENTYLYHTEVEACTNIFGAIKYAIENGDWDIPTPVKQKPVPKSLTRGGQKYTRDEVEKAKMEIQRMMSSARE
jgi:HAMP domain-containing protein